VKPPALPRWIESPAALLAVVIGGAALLVGCQASGPIAGRQDQAPAEPNVTFASKSLAKATELKAARVARTEGGLLSVTQPIRAETDDALEIEYRFVWRDAQGRVVPPQMTWRHKRLESYVLEFLEGNAVSDNAVDWLLELRWAKP
jgi:uncharacterized protein YcfL